MSKTLGLALGAGGARGVAHIGVLAALEEAGIKPDFIAGCSMGAVVGGCYASGMTVEELKNIVLQLKKSDIIDISPAFITRMAILRTKKVSDLLTSYLGNKFIEDMKIPFKCVATDLYAGEEYVFDKGPMALAVQASSTMPGVFRPVEHGGRFFVDGCCLCRVPTKIVKDMGADVVVAVDALANTSEPVDKLGNIIALLLRVFDVMDAHQTELLNKRDEGICDVLIRPEMKGMAQYAIKELGRAFDEGYAAAKEKISEIKELLK